MMCGRTFSGHADGEALLQSTVLAAVATEGRDLALLPVRAAMVHSLSDAPSKETLKQRVKDLHN